MSVTPVRSRWIGALAIAVAVASMPLALADGQKFYKAYYLEHAKGDLSAAAELYRDVVGDRGADRDLRSEAAAAWPPVRRSWSAPILPV